MSALSQMTWGMEGLLRMEAFTGLCQNREPETFRNLQEFMAPGQSCSEDGKDSQARTKRYHVEKWELFLADEEIGISVLKTQVIEFCQQFEWAWKLILSQNLREESSVPPRPRFLPGETLRWGPSWACADFWPLDLQNWGATWQVDVVTSYSLWCFVTLDRKLILRFKAET